MSYGSTALKVEGFRSNDPGTNVSGFLELYHVTVQFRIKITAEYKH